MSTKIRVYKHKLIPTKSQEDKLERTLETHRILYNMAYFQRLDAWKKNKITLNWYDQKKELTQALPYFDAPIKCNRNSLDATLFRLHLAFKSFWSGLKKGTKVGFPKHKKYGTLDSFEYVRHKKGFEVFPLEEGRKKTKIRLQHIGTVKMWCNRPIEGTIKKATIIRECDGWYASITCEVGTLPETIKDWKAPVGIDVGLLKFLTLSDGSIIENPKYLKSDLDSIVKLDELISRKKKGSNTKKRVLNLRARKYKRISNLRKEFIYTIVNSLLSKYDFIVLEDLNIKEMMFQPGPLEGESKDKAKDRQKRNRKKKHLSLAIADAAWYKFRLILTYKAKELGIPVVLVNPKYTSQICSGCGVKVKKTLSDRVHSCPSCGLEIDRDLNAAKNILNKGLVAYQKIDNGKKVTGVSVIT